MDISSEELEKLVVGHPKARSMRYWRFGNYDAAWTGLCASGLLLSMILTEGLLLRLLLLLVVSIWAGLMYVSDFYDERLFMVPFIKFQSFWIRKVKKGVLWDAEKSKKHYMKPVVYAFGELGLIYNEPKDTDTMIIESNGSTIVAKTLRGQYAVHAAIAEVYRRAAAIERGSVQIQALNRARPEDSWKLWDMLSAEGEPEVVLPRANSKPEEELTDFDRRMLFLNTVATGMMEVYEVSNLATMAFVITVKRSQAFRKASKKGKMTQRERDTQTLSRIRKVAVTTLENQGFEGVHVLNAAECERYLRQSWDVTGLPDYYARAHERMARGEEATTDQWYPEKRIVVTNDSVQIDGTYGAVMKLTAAPSGVLPHESRSFFASHSRWFANTVMSEVTSGNWEYNLTHLTSGFIGDLIGILGIEWSGPKIERKESEVRDRMRELDQSTFKQDFVPLATVSAGSKEELEDAFQAEFDRMTGLGRAPVRITEESRVWQYYMTGVTAIDHTS